MTRKKKIELNVAEFLTVMIEACEKPQWRIAEECGFAKANNITMLKQGRTKVPIAKVGPIARSLGIDAFDLYGRAMREYQPETWDELEQSIFKQPRLSREEIEFVVGLRKLNADIEPYNAQLKLLIAARSEASKQGAPGPASKQRE